MYITRTFLMLGVVWLCLSGCASQQLLPQTKAQFCPNHNGMLSIVIDKSTVMFGEEVVFTICTNHDGYATLWSTGSNGQIGRIYPRASGSAESVRTGQPYVAGKFVVRGPVGQHLVYAVWTNTPNIQPTAAPVCAGKTVVRNYSAQDKSLAEPTCATARVAFNIIK